VTKLDKAKSVYLALVARGFTHRQATDAALAGPLARSTFTVSRRFLAWAHEESERAK